MKLKSSKLTTLFLAISIYVAIFIFLQGKLPDPKTLLAWIENLYKHYGYIVVFAGALIEGLFLIGNYFPGSTIVFAGAALSRKGILLFPLALCLAIIALNIAFIINYILGRYGWYHILEKYGLHESLLKAKETIQKNETKAFLAGYAIINTAAILSTAAGVIKMPFKKFIVYSIISQTIWGIVWGTVAYTFGLQIIEAINSYLPAIIFGIGLIWIIRHVYKNL